VESPLDLAPIGVCGVGQTPSRGTELRYLIPQSVDNLLPLRI
jgi:hypothetical protein